MAEFTVGAILVETRLIRLGHETMRKGLWRGDLYRADRAGRELSGNDSGLNRLRSSRHARRAAAETPSAAECWSTVRIQISEQDRLDGVKQVSLEHLLRESDVVSVHAA